MITVNNTTNQRKLREKIVLAEWAFEYYEASYNSLARKQNITLQEMEKKKHLYLKCEEAEERIYFLKNMFNDGSNVSVTTKGNSRFGYRLRRLLNSFAY